MSYAYWQGDAAAHLMAGFAASGVSHILYRRKNQSMERIAQKRACLSSIEIILDSQPMKTTTPAQDAASTMPSAAIAIDSLQYAQNVMAVRAYLSQEGKISPADGLLKRIGMNIKAAWSGDLLNRMDWARTLGFAICAELTDTAAAIAVGHSTANGESPLGSFWRNSYQVPMFIGGMYLGRGVVKSFRLMHPKEERALDRTIDGLMKQTNIVDIIMNYEAPETVHRELQTSGVKVITGSLNRAGRKLTSGARSAISAISTSRNRREEQHEKEKEERRKRFNEIVNLH